MSTTIVIGANYGDEGKGLITDFEVARKGAKTVARFNGGAQAGHTVVRDGKRHVYGHLGAGTFAGAGTYLSSKFLVNPLQLEAELRTLKTLGHNPDVHAHPDARVTTIFDMAMNSIAELMRGNDRHGSCGMGINETVTRHAAGFEFTVSDLGNRERIEYALHRIQNVWVPERMDSMLMGKTVSITALKPFMDIMHLPLHVIADQLHRAAFGLMPYAPPLREAAVLEGAQGLMLDEFLGDFPHVTRSMTGLPYALMCASELGIKSVQPVYVTRGYLTRHGAGHLDAENVHFNCDTKAFPADSTNVLNKWQGGLRYAPLDIIGLKRFIWNDVDRAEVIGQMYDIEIKTPTIAVTCLDQLDENIVVRDSVDYFMVSNHIKSAELPRLLEKRLELRVSHVSRGPEAKDVTFNDFEVQ